MSVDLLCIDPDKTAAYWPTVKPFIEAGYGACDEFVPEDLPESLASGKILLWIGVVDERITAALATVLFKRPSGPCCRMLGAGGSELENFKVWHDRIEEYARSEGCVKLVSECRDGWLRALPGYLRVRSVIEKDL